MTDVDLTGCRCQWSIYFWNKEKEEIDRYVEQQYKQYPFYAARSFPPCPGEDELKRKVEDAQEAWRNMLFQPINAGATGNVGMTVPGEKWKDTRAVVWGNLTAAKDSLQSHYSYQKKNPENS